jgi:hypothetical protein
MARMIAEIIFIFDFESWKKNAILRMMQTILSAKPEDAPSRRYERHVASVAPV